MFGQYESFDPAMFDPGTWFPDISLPTDFVDIYSPLYSPPVVDASVPPIDTSLDIYSAYFNPVTQQYELPVGMSASAQPIAPGLSTTPTTGIIQSILGAGVSIAASILGRGTTSPVRTSSQPYYNPATGQYQTTPYVAATGATSLLSSLKSSLPLLAIAGGGTYFLLRKKKGRK